MGDGDAESGDGEAEAGDGEAESGEGDADSGGGDPPDEGASVGTGGGGACGGLFWKIRMATSTASAMISIISSHDSRIDSQPARSWRPGHGSGHVRATPGRTRSTQWSR